MKSATGAMNRVIVGVGSNIDPYRHIAVARSLLTRECDFLAQSRFVRTAPIGDIDQEDFVNGAYLLRTATDRESFARILKGVEAAAGRKPRTGKWGPREIDLDIVVWNGEIVHEDVYSRNFLQTAIHELDPDVPVDKPERGSYRAISAVPRTNSKVRIPPDRRRDFI